MEIFVEQSITIKELIIQNLSALLDKHCFIDCGYLITELNIFDFVKEILSCECYKYYAIDIAMYFILFALHTEENHDSIEEQLSDGVIYDEVEEILENTEDQWLKEYLQIILDAMDEMMDISD